MGQDPDMKLNFIGDGMSVGSVMEFAGNKSGSGKIELLKLNPNQGADYKLTMIKPFFAENLVEYRLTPEGTGTRFQWIMSGDGGFIGKVIATLIDCDKMIGKDFEKGIANLKQKVESQNTVVK
jgi:Polyketide cyclase / dehydrase and lipid transport